MELAEALLSIRPVPHGVFAPIFCQVAVMYLYSLFVGTRHFSITCCVLLCLAVLVRNDVLIANEDELTHRRRCFCAGV